MDRFRSGDWLAVCDRCGFTFKSHQLRKEWTGLRVCDGPSTNGCWETRHPQEFVKGREDRQTPPWTRPEAPDVFLPVRVWNDETKAWELP